jgi:glyoxylase-like metal-dependent hydrolase (beta-lactamase superfamily II)
MKRTVVLGILVAIGAVAMAAKAQNPPPTQNVAEIEKIKDNLYAIKGGGVTTAAFITASGVVVVDTKVANWGQAILDKIRSVTDKPVTMIINTHTHGDHVGSNAEFPPTVEIVAHENTKANMEKMPAFQGQGAQFLPKRIFKEKLTLLGGNDRIDLYYFGSGHTNGGRRRLVSCASRTSATCSRRRPRPSSIPTTAAAASSIRRRWRRPWRGFRTWTS